MNGTQKLRISQWNHRDPGSLSSLQIIMRLFHSTSPCTFMVLYGVLCPLSLIASVHIHFTGLKKKTMHLKKSSFVIHIINLILIWNILNVCMFINLVLITNWLLSPWCFLWRVNSVRKLVNYNIGCGPLQRK